MSRQPYADYKDSGAEWLGEVPSHWGLVPVKHLARFFSGGTPSKENEDYWEGEIPWASAKDMKVDVLSDTEDHITDFAIEQGAATLLDRGTVLIVVRGMILARTFPVCLTRAPMAINQDLKGLVAGPRILPGFLAWYLRGTADESLRRLDEAGHGTKALRMDAWSSLPVALPPLPEQALVVAFLDRETARIDALIAEQERLIALVKEKRQAVISHAVTKGLNPAVPMKDSGIDWLGEVPEHWIVAPVGYRYEVQLGKMLDSAKVVGENLRPYLRVFDVQWGEINTDNLPLMDFYEDDRARYSLQAGDLLVNEGGSYVGRSAIWRGEIEECYYQKALHRLRPASPSRDFSEFLYYVMFFATHLGVFVAGGRQATIEHLTAEALRRYRFAFPPFPEQVTIVTYLEAEAAKLNALVAEAERAIDLLREHRAALISAAVTGKIDVRGLVDMEAA